MELVLVPVLLSRMAHSHYLRVRFVQLALTLEFLIIVSLTDRLWVLSDGAATLFRPDASDLQKQELVVQVSHPTESVFDSRRLPGRKRVH